MLCGAALFIHLGQWQYGKAERKRAAQALLDNRHNTAPVPMPTVPITAPDSWRYAPVILRGRYDTAHQFLVDNRVDHERAGYHVVTPLQLSGSDLRVLVNRGWVPAAADHREVPSIATPEGEVELRGTVVIPPTRFFSLGQDGAATGAWQPVWQHLDMARFAAAVAYPVQPLVVELDPAAPSGFARDWPRPDERWERHLSYAFQWYGFAASALLIWFVTGWRARDRVSP